uniref:Uncharacterized protein n=1 Tax=Alexandrium andersonii TaxID=327968 RepID=A0A7S2GXS0_9DINO
MNRDLTRALIPLLSQHQLVLRKRKRSVPDAASVPIPALVAERVSEFLGHNDLATGAELTKIKERAQDQLWEKFFAAVLRPRAEAGRRRAKLNICDLKKYFPKLDSSDVKDIAQRKKVKAKTKVSEPWGIETLTFSW